MTERYARKIFNRNEDMQAHIKLREGTVDKAYARAIFGYEPEHSWGVAAWSLATELLS